MSKVRVYGEKDLQRELKAFIDLCLSLLDGYDDKEICNLTGLCLSTVKRYKRGEYTGCCHWNTIQRFSKASGLQLTWTENRFTMRLVSK
jgi:hypothetical protein